MKNRKISIILTAVLLFGSLAAATNVSADASQEADVYQSELTNEWIDASLKDQRPIAVMVDNESIALPHYGITQADVVYEIMNSTANGRITRLMAIVKDWRNLKQFGSIRSTRPTNFPLAAEWNAVLIHDGGPSYIKPYLTKDYVRNLSGGFARFNNGKAMEFTEYVTSEPYNTYKGLIQRMEEASFSTSYDELYEGPHFQFSDDEIDLSYDDSVIPASVVELPFPHNSSTLTYNEETGTYDYSEYGHLNKDAGNNDKVLTFKNLILQDCDFTQLDDNGYMEYNCLDNDRAGYYLTNGDAIPITWTKTEEAKQTKFYHAVTGEEIQLNTGKTYISLVPSDVWDAVILQ